MQPYFTITKSELINALKEKKIFLKEIKTNQIEILKKPQIDSRQVKSGDIFFCIKGYQTDGHSFVEEAIKNGAALLLTEKKVADFPQILVTNTRKAAAVCAALYYQTKKHTFKLVGITGTNGKTTTSILLYEMLKNQGKKVGLIGTLGYRIREQEFPLNHTTPDSIELHKILAEMKNLDFVIMEVSSHALSLDRVFGLYFSVSIFTNLSHDHLDFHETIEQYAEEKYKLFKQTVGLSIFNIDDAFGRKFYERCQSEKLSFSQKKGDFRISNLSLTAKKSDFVLSCEKFQLNLSCSLIGVHNVYNFCAAYLAFRFILPEYEETKFATLQKSQLFVPGRLEPVENNKNLAIYVDYAHTPDALENVLSTLKPLTKKRLICVFGAGGNRDRKKRPKMLEAALKWANLAIVTSDNPRHETPENIIREIVAESDFSNPYWIEKNREKAIEIAARLLTKDDVLLIAGKGHETYQIIGAEKYHFDDKEKVGSALNLSKNEESELAVPIDSLNLEKLFNQKLQTSSSFKNVSTDSRACHSNSIFFALKGERFDGHQFVEEVLAKENCAAVVNKTYDKQQPNVIVVADSLKAYGKLAKKYQTLFAATKIAITGSVGKTTTKEYLFKILSANFSTLKTDKNENNQIGLPKTLFKLKPNHTFAILEVGTNHFGEIAYLTNICTPEIGIITNIGASHLEFFGDEDGVFKEKIALLNGTKNLPFFPGDDLRFSGLQGITFGEKKDCSYRLSELETEQDKISFRVNEEQFQISSSYPKNVNNAFIAIAVAKELGISSAEIRQSLTQEVEIPLRMQLIRKNGKLYLADCYNANPQSMQAAIDYWQQYEPAKPHVAILGDMLELGKKAVAYHKEIGSKMKSIQKAMFISIGTLSQYYQADEHFPAVDDFMNWNLSHVFPEDAVILIKASHGIHLEKILEG